MGFFNSKPPEEVGVSEEVEVLPVRHKDYSTADLRRIGLTVYRDYATNRVKSVSQNVENRNLAELDSGQARILNDVREQLANYRDGVYALTDEQIEKAVLAVKSYIWGYDIIDPLIADPEISDIKIYAYDNIRVKRLGHREAAEVQFESPKECEDFITRILERNGINFGTANADQTFTDNDQDFAILRISAISGMLTDDGLPCIAIRKVPKNKRTVEDLSDAGMFNKNVNVRKFKMAGSENATIHINNKEIEELIPKLIQSRGILFTGKGASGKTTFMNALLDLIPYDESIMICQENSELFATGHPDCLCTHVDINGGDSKISYTLGDLTRMGLLIDLDRIIVGEVKQPDEAAGLSKASLTGHKCWTSVHGENCQMAIDKMADYISQANKNYSFQDCLSQLQGFEYVIHLRWFQVDEIVHIKGWDRENGRLITETIYKLDGNTNTASQ